jgi:hypothetical protein
MAIEPLDETTRKRNFFFGEEASRDENKEISRNQELNK